MLLTSPEGGGGGELAGAARCRRSEWAFALRPISRNGLLAPMRWGSPSDYSSKPNPRVIRTLPGPVRPHRLDQAVRLLLLPLPRPHSPVPLPRTNSIPTVPSAASSRTEAELSVHCLQNPLAALSPLRNNSHRPSRALEGWGRVAGGGGGEWWCWCSAPTRLREALCSQPRQPRQPSSLSQQPIKSSRWRRAE